jgi:Fe2+ or Zn2+ uptake regulation protein
MVLAKLRRVNQRYTASRRALVDTLVTAGAPVTIPEVVRAGAVPVSSVYRNLTVLENAGAVRRIVTDHEFSRYELAEDLLGHHHHLVCGGCGLVEDFTLPEPEERRLASALALVARHRRFGVIEHRLHLVGTCPRCDEEP